MKIIRFVIFLLITFVAGLALHESVHVIQYYVLYGDNIISLNVGLDRLGGFTTVSYIPGTKCILDTMSPTTELLFLEIPAYGMNILVSIFASVIYFNHTLNWHTLTTEVRGLTLPLHH